MTPGPYVVQDVAHRLRVATQTAAAIITEMSRDPSEAELVQLRADLRGYTLMVAEAADRLYPICSTAVGPELPECLVRAGAGR